MNDPYQIISFIVDRKLASRLFPPHATELEVRELYDGDSLGVELEALISVGLIRRGSTINQTYYTLVKL